MILITDASRDYVLTSRGSRAMPFDRSADRQRAPFTANVGHMEAHPATQPAAESINADHDRAPQHDDADAAQV